MLVLRKWELISEEVITCRRTYSNVNLAVVEWNTPWYSFVRATVPSGNVRPSFLQHFFHARIDSAVVLCLGKKISTMYGIRRNAQKKRSYLVDGDVAQSSFIIFFKNSLRFRACGWERRDGIGIRYLQECAEERSYLSTMLHHRVLSYFWNNLCFNFQGNVGW